ncbi:MAG: hypothetical protein COB09_19145 [Thalassobium sp.]|nr:MAG: hypothetical protein COB09_19145 [Thalassobium sp.]
MAYEFKAQSGEKIIIEHGDFEDVMDLKDAIEREIAKHDIKIDSLDFDTADFDLSVIPKIMLSIDSSKEIRDLIFKCLVRSTRGGDKIMKCTFEEIEARGDWYQISTECVKVNLSPFFKPLLSLLKPIMDKVNMGKTENSPE